MNDIVFKTAIIKGAKGDRGQAGSAEALPTGSVIAWESGDIPEGYEETTAPSTWLKKIASTPLDIVAKVIDSLTSGADSTTNAPSIRAVNSALSDKASNDDLLQAVADINEDIATKADKASMFLVREYTYNYTLSAGEYMQATASDLGITAISGYTPLMFERISNGSRYINLVSFFARTNATVISARNMHTAEVSNTLTVRMVFVRNDVIGA